MNWQVARWWALFNSVGMLITMVAIEANYSSHVRAHEFNPRPPGYASTFLALLLVLIAMGLLQVAVCCAVIALNRSRRKALHVALGVAVGVLTALVIPVLGMFVIYVLAVAAFYTLLPSGIIFGTMAGISRWRSELFS